MAETEPEPVDLLEEAREALLRVQDFDTRKLVREAELGKKFAMHEAVGPAKRVIELFKLISPSQLEFFPDEQLVISVIKRTRSKVY